MDTTRTAVLIAFGLLAALAYAPLLIVAYQYVAEGEKALAYASAMGALVSIVVCTWFVLFAWRLERKSDL
jgi:hypothetical protein